MLIKLPFVNGHWFGQDPCKRSMTMQNKRNIEKVKFRLVALLTYTREMVFQTSMDPKGSVRMWVELTASLTRGEIKDINPIKHRAAHPIEKLHHHLRLRQTVHTLRNEVLCYRTALDHYAGLSAAHLQHQHRAH